MENKIGLYGLGVMGRSLAQNMAIKGEKVAVYNYTSDLTETLMHENPHDNITPYYDLCKFVKSLERPRKVFLMVTAGSVVDSVIESLIPLLNEGDIIMDGGNSNFNDSNQRYHTLKDYGLHFISVGVSGGEKGALQGPALMPSGDEEAYSKVAPILEKTAAQVDGRACCSYLGTEGAGHYVKMIHNGIEYADMQLITEAYVFLKEKIGLSVAEIANIFKEWNQTGLKSYLIEITGEILEHIDPETNEPTIERILDKAKQKGTGKWVGKDALDIGVPSSIITEAVFSRFISALKKERTQAAIELSGQQIKKENLDKEKWIQYVKEALYMGKMVAYAQGFYQYKVASDKYGWNLRLDEIALNFRGGCIIRADFLNIISDALGENTELPNLLLAPYFKKKAHAYESSLRRVVIKGMENGISLPCLSQSIAYYDGYRTANSGANLIQAQRDYFGAHTYERVDKEGTFHTDW